MNISNILSSIHEVRGSNTLEIHRVPIAALLGAGVAILCYAYRRLECKIRSHIDKDVDLVAFRSKLESVRDRVKKLEVMTYSSDCADSDYDPDDEHMKDRKGQKLHIQEYSDRSFVVRGYTKPYKDDLTNLGGRLNQNLRCGKAWVFSNRCRGKVEGWLSNLRQ